ncbi:MAG TPA: zinc ribbon domain-containing protein [Geothermobacteraceae bacterium]|nr:zinc ribbon domain-containing protein [Geothermobacteraceae bacterium]
MILTFLLIFAFLTLAIVRQIEAGLEEPQAPSGACPSCGCRVEFDWLICPHCKELLLRPCAGCNERLPVSHRFCTGCGTRHEPVRLEVPKCA